MGIWGRELEGILKNPYMPWVSMTTSQKPITHQGTDVIHILEYGHLLFIRYVGLFNIFIKGDEAKIIFIYVCWTREYANTYSLVFRLNLTHKKTINQIKIESKKRHAIVLINSYQSNNACL